jgi:hypothetical protein
LGALGVATRIPIILTLLLVTLSNSSHAFDPAGPPPAKTLSWTASFASKVTIPRIRYKDETPERAVHHMLGVIGIPADYSITVDTTRLKLSNPAVITFDADNITLLQALARVAEQVHANLLITPGSIVLQPQ